MKSSNFLKISALGAFIIAIGFFVYMINISKVFSYFSSDPKACINCHVMNDAYATWQHSSHFGKATCIDCHTPIGFVQTYVAKAIDGWNHSVAFTLNTYDHSMRITEGGAARVQTRCISCHSSLSENIIANADKYHSFDDPMVKTGRRCWECHQEVPHGKVRSIVGSPNNLDVKKLNF